MAGPRRGKREKDGAKGARVLIVEARYYDDIADLLLAGAMKVLKAAGAEVERITVPGSLEIPAAIAIAVDAAQNKRRRPMTASWRSAASSAATPSISRSFRSFPRKA